MNQLRNKSIFIIILSLSINALASGAGVRGGGHVIDINSSPHLLDLVSKSTCRWKRGADLIKELVEIKSVFSKLDRLDWYFSSDLKQEITQLNYCFTGSLRPVPAYDKDSVSLPLPNQKLYQAGFRWNENVYIDQNIFKKMNPINKTMLIIHEAMHSYFPMETVERILKLTSVVNDIYKVRNNQIVTREELHYSFTMNQIQFPLSVMNLESYKTAIQFLKNPPQDQIKAILNTQNLDELIQIDDIILRSLAPWDMEALGSFENRKDILEKAIIQAMITLDSKALSHFIQEKYLNGQNLLTFAFTHLSIFNPEQLKVIMSKDNLELLAKVGFSEIINEKLYVKDHLIYPSIKLQKLITNNFMNHEPLVNLESANHFPTRLIWVVEEIILLYFNNKLSLVTSNPDFYRALGLKNQKEQIEKIEVPIAREKTIALQRLNLLSDAIVTTMLSTLRSRLSESDYNQVLKNINLNNFKKTN